ncbi:glycosyltransferase [bacterium]|nr:glycosyltransferase [bacterium]
MRVMLIAGRAGNGTCGVADHALFLAAELARPTEGAGGLARPSSGEDAPKALNVDLVYRRGTTPQADYEPALEGRPALTLRPISGFGSEKWGELVALARDLKPDIVHLQYPAAEYRFSTMPVLLGAFRRRLRRARLVVTLHEFAASHYLRRQAASLLARKADAVIVPSAHNFGALQRKFAAKIHYIPNGNFFSMVGPGAAESAPREPQLLHFGLPSKTKDYARLLTLFERLRRDNPDLTLRFVTPKSAELRLRLRYGIRHDLSGVKFAPPQPLPELWRLAESSLLVIFPFSFDTHRSSLINALSFGTPIAALGVHPRVAVEYAPNLPLAAAEDSDVRKLSELVSALKDDYASASVEQLARQERLRNELSMPQIAARHTAVYNQLV